VAERKKAAKKSVKARAPTKPVEAEVVAVAPPTLKPPQSFAAAFCIVGSHDAKLFGLTTAERIREQFRRAGLTTEIAFDQRASHNGPTILVNGQGVLDQPLIAALIKRPNLAIVSEKQTGSKTLAAHVRASDVEAVVEAMQNHTTFQRAGVLQRAPSEMDTNFWAALRKRETPYALPLNADNQAAVEWRMFMGTYKGANMVTTVGAVMTVAAFILFLYGQYGLGLLAAWAMTFLDTVDGKLARTTLTSSKWGDIFDHGIDLVHPPFWYMAWAWGLIFWGITWSTQLFWGTIAIILGGYVLQRLVEGAAIQWLGLEIHIWRKIDTFFRQITARRNPNLILLTLATLAGRPDIGLLAVAAWTAICFLLHAIQLLQAFAAKKSGGPLQSWMTKP
jgi:phosphatidylglycerophosphate synthase